METLESIGTCRHEWLVPGLIPLSCCTGIVGVSETGKSTFACRVAAHVSGGRPIIGKKPKSAYTLWYVLEEHVPTMTAPRLRAAGAKLVSFPGLDGDGSVRDRITVPDRIGEIGEIIDRTGARLVFFDPIQSFVNSAFDVNNYVDVRGMMQQLNALAAAHRCAVLVTLHHRKERRGGNALDWIAGSAAWGQTCRAVIQLSRNPDGERYLLSFAKFSIGPRPAARWYTLEDCAGVPVFTLGDEADARAEDGGEAMLNSAEMLERSDCLAIMESMLAGGRQEVKTFFRAWCEHGFSKASYWQARRELGVKWEREGAPGESQVTYLYLPGRNNE